MLVYILSLNWKRERKLKENLYKNDYGLDEDIKNIESKDRR